MNRRSSLWWTLPAALLCGFSGQDPAGQTAKRPAPESAPAAESKDRAADAAAIRATNDLFIKAYNAGNAEAIGALFTVDAEAIDEVGESTVGRAAITQMFADAFAESPGGKLTIESERVRFIGPDTAIETGRSTVLPAENGEPDIDRYTAVYVRQDGRWLQAIVREHPDTTLTPHDHLKQLEWMIGEWVDESDAAYIKINCRWSDDGNFLLRDYVVQFAGKPQASGVQRIGWDPVAEQFRSWIFDTTGGFGEGFWSRDGLRWVVKTRGADAGGEMVTSTNVITYVNKHTMRWRVVDRTTGSAVEPDIDEFTIARRPPEPTK